MIISATEYAQLSKCTQIFSKFEHQYGCRLPSQWQVIATKTDQVSGYTAIAYKKGQEIVIGHRGTDDAQDIKADAALLFKKLPKEQYDIAVKFTAEMKSANPDSNFSHTGYSLGATLAQLVAIRNGNKATVFDGPGVQEIAERVFGKELTLKAASKINIFLAYPNGVNSINTHISKPFLVPHNNGMDEKYDNPDLIDFAHFTLAQHNIRAIAAKFTEGNPESFKKIFCKWPSVSQAAAIFIQGKMALFSQVDNCKKFMANFELSIVSRMLEGLRMGSELIKLIGNNIDPENKASFDEFTKSVDKAFSFLDTHANILGVLEVAANQVIGEDGSA